jgi:hypothetical protein
MADDATAVANPTTQDRPGGDPMADLSASTDALANVGSPGVDRRAAEASQL